MSFLEVWGFLCNGECGTSFQDLENDAFQCSKNRRRGVIVWRRRSDVRQSVCKIEITAMMRVTLFLEPFALLHKLPLHPYRRHGSPK